MLLLNLAILAVIGAIVWWLTGIDKTVSGESKRGRYFTRTIRCVLVLFAVMVMLWVTEGGGGYSGGVLLLIFPMLIALLLRSSISELFTHGFIRMADPSLYDDRELDLKKAQRYQDTIAHMIHHGHRDAAIKLCEDLKKSG